MAYLQCPSKSKCYGIMRTRSLFQRFPMSATVLRSMWSCFTVPDTGSPFGTHVRFHALGLGRHSGRGPKVLHGSSPSHHWFRSRRKMPMTSLLQLNDDIWGINGFYNKTLQCLLSLMITRLQIWLSPLSTQALSQCCLPLSRKSAWCLSCLGLI